MNRRSANGCKGCRATPPTSTGCCWRDCICSGGRRIGVKLGNPSQSVKQNLVAKRAFAVQRGRYRVARDGLGHLEQLTGRRLSDS
jgi:hypothetical protein